MSEMRRRVARDPIEARRNVSPPVPFVPAKYAGGRRGSSFGFRRSTSHARRPIDSWSGRRTRSYANAVTRQLDLSEADVVVESIADLRYPRR
jgi:hypothetical protein